MGPLPGSVYHCCVAHALLCRPRHAVPRGERATACRRLFLCASHTAICRGCGMDPSKDVFGEPRQSTQLRKLTPINDRRAVADDYDDDDDEYPPPYSYPPRGRSPAARRVSFSDDEEDDGALPASRARPPPRAATPPQRRTPGPSSAASASVTDCRCAPGAATRRPSAVAAAPSSCSCGTAAAPEPAEDVEYLYPSRSRSKSPPCPAVARHTCSMASKPPANPCSLSFSSVDGADSKLGSTCGPCAPSRRLTAEDLVERRQPSWWEPALSRVLSVVVSTVLLLATGGAQPSAEHLNWTKDFLRCVKDRAGNPPPNVAALLAYLESMESAPAKEQPAPAQAQAEPPQRQRSTDVADRVSRTSRSSRISL